MSRKAYLAIAAACVLMGGCGPDDIAMETGPRRFPELDVVPGRVLADQPDESALYQVHAIYVVPSDGQDRQLDVNGALERSITAFNTWLARQANGARVRFDRIDGQLDISFFRSSQTDAEMADNGPFVRDVLEDELSAAGFDQPNKMYAVYYDGTSTFACGGCTWPPDFVGRVVALYLNGLPTFTVPCRAHRFANDQDDLGYYEFAMLHEIVHALGFAALCAPNQGIGPHTTDDPLDLMYAGDQPWQPARLDPGRDDYYDHGIDDCLDLKDSAFLEPLPPALSHRPAGETSFQ
ncbi:MAG: hypothetical protein AAF449_11325 [Myxococcota bacterium]